VLLLMQNMMRNSRSLWRLLCYVAYNLYHARVVPSDKTASI